MENAVPDEKWNQVKDYRRKLIMEHWDNLVAKLKEIYGQRFNVELYYDAQHYVNGHLRERKQIEKGQERSTLLQQGILDTQSSFRKNRHTIENVL